MSVDAPTGELFPLRFSVVTPQVFFVVIADYVYGLRGSEAGGDKFEHVPRHVPSGEQQIERRQVAGEVLGIDERRNLICNS